MLVKVKKSICVIFCMALVITLLPLQFTKVKAEGESSNVVLSEDFNGESYNDRFYATDGSLSLEDGALKISGRTATWGGSISYSFCNLNYGATNQLITLVPGVTYTVKAKMKLGENATDGTSMFIGATIDKTNDNDASVCEYPTYETIEGSKTEFKEVTAEFTPDQDDYGQFDIKFGIPDSEDYQCDYYIDDVEITSSAAVLPKVGDKILDEDFSGDYDHQRWYGSDGEAAVDSDGALTVTGRTQSWGGAICYSFENHNYGNDFGNEKLVSGVKYKVTADVKLGANAPDDAQMYIGGTVELPGASPEYPTYDTLANPSKTEFKKISAEFTPVFGDDGFTQFDLKFSVAATSEEASYTCDFSVDNVVVEVEEVNAAAPSIQEDLKPLKDIFTDGTKFGVALPGSALNNPTKVALATKHFNSVTAENEFKPSFLMGDDEPTADNLTSDGFVKLDFSTADPFVTMARDNNMGIRGHVLIWYNQTPEWFFREGYKNDGALVSKDVMTARIRNYIKQVMDHFYPNGLSSDCPVYAWDVVNECIEIPDGMPNGMRNSNYYKIYGNSDYIIEAFKAANEFAPSDVKLFYNDYAEADLAKSEKIADLLTTIKNADGTRITGMGMQSHYKVETPSKDAIIAAARKYAAIVDEIQFTELDLEVSGDYSGNKSVEYIKQAYRFKDIYDAIKELKADGVNVSCLTVWGLTDDSSWLSMPEYSNGKQHFPLLFDKNYQAKPAYWAFVDSSKLEPMLQSCYVLNSEDLDWNIANTININNAGTKADAKLLWSDGKLNIKFNVEDASNDASDEVKFYVDKNNTKSDSVDSDVKTYTIKRSDCTETSTGYTKTVAISVDSLANNSKIGFDMAVTNGTSTYSWSDLNNTQSTQTKYYGDLTFKPFMKIAKGTPVIDGKIDDIWNSVPEVSLNTKTSKPAATGTVKAMWDEGHLYVLAKVKDSVLNDSSKNDYEQDSIEVFLDEDNAKSNNFDSNDYQYRVSYKNKHSFNGLNCVEDNIKSYAVETDDGYYVELAINLNEITPKINDLIGVDFQINDANAAGSRVGTWNWFDQTGNGWQNPGVFGTAQLVDSISAEAIEKLKDVNNNDNVIIGSITTKDLPSATVSIDKSALTDEQKNLLASMTNEELQAEINKIIETISSGKIGNDSQQFAKLSEELKSKYNGIVILPITFSKDADFAVPINVAIDVSKSGIKDGTYYLYYMNPKTNEYEYVNEAKVENGIANLKISHCSQYFLSSVKIDNGKLPASDNASNPKTGEKMNWVLILLIGFTGVVTFFYTKKRKCNN